MRSVLFEGAHSKFSLTKKEFPLLCEKERRRSGKLTKSHNVFFVHKELLGKSLSNNLYVCSRNEIINKTGRNEAVSKNIFNKYILTN